MRGNSKGKNSIKLYADVDSSDIDRAIEKVNYLADRIKELNTYVNELSSGVKDIKLKINIQS